MSYEADERGFKPQISYEDSEDLARSGYDSNANNARSNHGNGKQDGYPHGNQDGGYHGNHGDARSAGYWLSYHLIDVILFLICIY